MTVFRSAQDQMRANMLVKHFAGSLAYGTSLPTSDVDFRGIFVADPVSVRTPFFRVDEVEDTTEADTKLYELANFMKLALDCNPNVVETLWVDIDDVVQMHPAYQLLRDAAPKLLSRKIAFTTSGYALAQLKRIRGHNKWITQADNGIKKLREAFQAGEVDKRWLDDHFDQNVVERVIRQ